MSSPLGAVSSAIAANATKHDANLQMSQIRIRKKKNVKKYAMNLFNSIKSFAR